LGLTSIYPGLQSEAFAQAVIDLKQRLTDLDAYLINGWQTPTVEPDPSA
jgi:hypothetical protein